MANEPINIAQMLAQKISARAKQTSKENLPLLAWGRKYLPKHFRLESNEAHYALEKLFESFRASRGQKVVIRIPRGYAKSTVASFAGVLKGICEGTEHYTLLGAETHDLAAKYLANIKTEMESNEKLREDYPLACVDPDVWRSDRIETRNGCCVEIFGKGTGVRGSRYKEHRPTLIILDDPQKDADVNSPDTRAKDVEWVNRTLLPVGDDGDLSLTNFLFIGNDLHQDSIVGTMARNPSFTHITYAAIINWPTAKDTLWEEWSARYWAAGQSEAAKKLVRQFYEDNRSAMDDGVKLLWPAKDSIYKLMTTRETMTYAAFEAEYQNDPRDPSKLEFDPAYTDLEKVGYDKLDLYNVRHVRLGYLDPAKGIDTKKHDHPAIVQLIYVFSERRAYIEFDMDKEAIDKRVNKIANIHRATPFMAFGCEANGFQYLVGERLTEKIPLLNMIPIDHYGVHKNTRISRLGIWFQRDFFRFKRGCKHTAIALDQVRQHPHSKHDDGPDGLEAIIRMLTSLISLDNAEEADPTEDGLGDNLCSVFR